MTPNIADHFDMPDAEQAGSAQAKQARLDGDLNLVPSYGLGYQVDRTYAMFNAIQQLDQVHRTLNHLQLPSIAAILNEAITALGQQWLDERKP
jgi:hypothetical protein